MKRAFILGNPRSGTSLLRIMLNAHSLAVAPPECGFLHWWYSKYASWRKDDSLNSEMVLNFAKDVLSSKKIEGWNLSEQYLVRLVQQRLPHDYASLAESVYLAYACEKSVAAIIDKNNYYINHLSDISSIWKDASYIHIVRDGRDVACSYLDLPALETASPYKPQLAQDLQKIASEWSTNNRSIRQFLKESVALENQVTIRYEDLIGSPEETLTKILQMISLKFESQMLEFYKFNDEPASTLDWKRKTLEALDASNINRFKTYLHENDVKAFENIAGSALKEFGYAGSF